MARRYRRVGHRLERLIERDGGERCYFCRRLFEVTGVRPTIDHLLPICRGGGNELANLVLVCQSCNRRKGARTADEFVATNYLASRRRQLKAEEQRAVAPLDRLRESKPETLERTHMAGKMTLVDPKGKTSKEIAETMIEALGLNEPDEADQDKAKPGK